MALLVFGWGTMPPSLHQSPGAQSPDAETPDAQSLDAQSGDVRSRAVAPLHSLVVESLGLAAMPWMGGPSIVRPGPTTSTSMSGTFQSRDQPLGS